MKLLKLTLFLLLVNTVAIADKNMKIGSKGNKNEVSRVIKVIMYDN